MMSAASPEELQCDQKCGYKWHSNLPAFVSTRRTCNLVFMLSATASLQLHSFHRNSVSPLRLHAAWQMHWGVG